MENKKPMNFKFINMNTEGNPVYENNGEAVKCAAAKDSRIIAKIIINKLFYFLLCVCQLIEEIETLYPAHSFSLRVILSLRYCYWSLSISV